MQAVTIVSPAYRRLGRECARRFKKYAGLELTVIQAKNGDDAFYAKLQLDQLLPHKPTVFVDCDLFLINRADFSSMAGSFAVVHDPAAWNPWAFPHTDCEAFGIPKQDYFNSGLMIVDLSNKDHRRMFQVARRIHRHVQSGKLQKPTDKTDQIFLNAARMELGLRPTMLPSMFNFYMKSAQWGQQPWIPRHIIGLHGAGIPSQEKYDRLCEQAKVFEYEARALHEEAAMFHAVRTVELQ